MAYSSDFTEELKGKKKKKKSDFAELVKSGTYNTNIIAPTVTTTKATTTVTPKKEESSWLKQLFTINDTYFKDGYQFGDLFKTSIDSTGKALSLFGAEKAGNTLQQGANDIVNNTGNTFKNIGEGILDFGSTLAYGTTEGIGQMGTTLSENIPYTLSNKVATQKDIEDYETKNKITPEKKQQLIDNYIKEYGDIDKATTELANLHVNKKDTLDNLKFAKFDKVAEMVSKEYVEAKKQNPKLTLDKYKEQVEKELKDIEYARDILQEKRGRKPFTDSASESLKAGLDLLGIGEFVNDFKEELKTPFNQVREWGQKTFGEGAQEFQEKHEFVGGITQSIGQLLPTIATVAITKNPTAGTAIFATSAKGGYYEDYIARGYTVAEAEKASNFMTTVEVGSEFIGGALGGVNIFKKGALKEFAKQPLVQTIKGFGVEGVEELIAEAASIGTDINLGEDVTLEEAGERAWTAFASGVVLGAVMKGAGVAGSKAQNIAERINRGEQVTEAEVTEALEEVAEQNDTTVEALLEEETNTIMQTTQEQSDQIIEEYEQKSTDVVEELNQKADEVLNNQEVEKNEAPQAEISDVSEQSQQVIFPEVETAQNKVTEPNTAIEENIPINIAENVSESQINEENVAESEKQIQVYNAVRIDEKNANLDAEAKPHGLFLSNLYETDFNEFESPFARQYEGGERHHYKVEPKNPLVVKPLVLDNAKYKYRGDGMLARLDADASLSALKELVGEQEFTKVSEMSKPELIEYLNSKFSQYDFSKYYDKAELLMAYGSAEARNRGYDAIITERSTDPDTADIDNEIVVLKNDILKTEAEAKETTKNKQEKTNITIDNEVNDFHSGETFSTMSAKVDGKVVGTLEYSEYEGKPSVKMVEVNPEYRRQGIGTKLLQELQKAYPNTEIDFGMLTDDGAKLLEKSTYEVEDREIAEKIARRDALQDKIDEYDKTLEDHYENDTPLPSENYAEDYNEIYDELQDLEKELRGKKATKRLVRETPTEAEIDNIIKLKEEGGQKYAKAYYEAVDKYGHTEFFKAMNEGYKRAKNQDIAPVKETAESNKEEYIKNRLAELKAIDISKMSRFSQERQAITAEIAALEDGYTDVEEHKKIKEQKKQEAIRKSEEKAKSTTNNKDIAPVIEETNTSDSEKNSKVKRAKEYFGVTTDLREAGYLTTDGEYIDLSGKNNGGKAGTRAVDHREISDIYTDEEYDLAEKKHSSMGTATAILQDFIEEGNIRLMPEQGVEIASEPTKAQYDKLYDYLSHVQKESGNVLIDLETETSNRENLQYNDKTSISKMINDIKNHFAKQSLTTEDIAPLQETISELTEQVKKLSDQVENAALNNPSLAENAADNSLDQQVEANNEPTEMVEDTTPDYDSLLNEMLEVHNENRGTETTSETRNDSELQSRNAENARAVQEKVSREINEYKTEVEDYVKEKITTNLGLDKKATKDIIDKISNKERVTEQDIYEAFEGHREIKLPLDKSIEAEYKAIKDYFKGRKLNVGSYNKADINAGEFNKFRRQYFGKTNFVLTGGENVDTAYMEMSDAYPHLFPDDITNPADQTMQIAKILDEVYNPTVETIELTDTDIADIAGTILDGYNMLNTHREALTNKYLEELNKQADLTSLEENIPIVEPQNENTDNQGREVSPELQEELKNSKVRDEQGHLLTVYHGTPNGGFTEFDISKRGTATDISSFGDYGKGFYFTPVKEGAESYTKSDYAEATNPQVYEVYLDLKNPLRLDVISGVQKDINSLGRKYGQLNIPDAEIDKVFEKYNITEEQYDEMSSLYDNLGDNWQDVDLSEFGYDGVINENKTEYVAFDTKQIKIINNNEILAPVTTPEANTDTLTEETTPDIPIAENVSETTTEAPKKLTVAPEMEGSENVQQKWNENGEIVDTETIEKKTRKEIQDKLIEEAGIVKENLDNAKDISKVLMHNTDPIRLQEIIFGKEIGRKINNGTFYVVKHNTAEKIRFQNQERDEIKELGVKPRSKESAAVQKYGEKQYVNEVGETVAYKDAELAAEFPDIKTQEKIKNAAKVIRQKYDSYIDRTNEVLTKLGYDAIPKRQDYMRHFQELNDIFSMYGLPFNMQSAQANDLPVDINGLTADLKPGKNWFASALKRTGNKTTYDAITGIDGYIEGIGNLIYHTEDIQRLRGFENYVREMYGQEHGFDNLDNLSEEEKAVRIQQIQNNHLGNYAAWLREYTNALAGKKAMVDRAVEDIFGRRVYSFLNELKSQVGSNMTGLNIGSALTNPISMTQALAKTNKLATVKGYADTIKNIFVKDNFVEQNDFLTARFGSDILSPTAWQKMRNAGQIFMTGTDWFASNSITRSKFYELKAKGLSDAEAHKQAGEFAARILGDRSQGATPTLYNSKMLGLVTQFQLEVNNQLYSQFYDTFSDAKQKAKEKGVLKATVGATFVLGQLAAYQHIYNNLYESIAGRRPAFDIIAVIATALGLGGDEDEEKKPLGDRLYEAADMLVDSLPYVNVLTGGGRIPISEALPISELFSGKDQYGNDKSRLETLGEALPYYFLPTGYGQIKKTVGGLGMYDDDLPVAGSYTKSGNLRFTAEEDAWSKIQAGLFGQWANDNAKDYISSEFKSVDKENIDELAELGFNSTEYRKYKKGLNEIKKMDLEDGEARAPHLFEYIESLNATDKQKGTMIRNLLSEQEQKDVYDKLEMSSDEIIEYYDAKSTISQQVAEYANDKKLLTEDTESEEYKEAVGSLSDEKKTKIIDTMLNADLTDKQKAYLYGKYYSSDKTLEKITSSGVAFDDFLTFSKDTIPLEETEEKVEYLYNSSLSDNTKRVLYETSVLSGFDNEKKYKDYKTAKAADIDINAWLSYKKQEFKADKDKYGDSISGTKKKKVINYINSLDLSIPQKAIMIKTEYETFNDYNYDIVSYVDGLDTTYDAKVVILENLGMEVDSKGNIYW